MSDPRLDPREPALNPDTPAVWFYAPFIADLGGLRRMLVQVTVSADGKIGWVAGAFDEGTGRWGPPIHFAPAGYEQIRGES